MDLFVASCSSVCTRGPWLLNSPEISTESCGLKDKRWVDLLLLEVCTLSSTLTSDKLWSCWSPSKLSQEGIVWICHDLAFFVFSALGWIRFWSGADETERFSCNIQQYQQFHMPDNLIVCQLLCPRCCYFWQRLLHWFLFPHSIFHIIFSCLLEWQLFHVDLLRENIKYMKKK